MEQTYVDGLQMSIVSFRYKHVQMERTFTITAKLTARCVDM